VQFEDYNMLEGLQCAIKDELEEGITSIINSAREKK
jgi:hypothetical protein